MAACSGAPNIDQGLSSSYYAPLADDTLHISPAKVSKWVTHYADMNSGRNETDRFVRRYYKHGGPFLWVGYGGVKPSADSLLQTLDSVGRYNLDPGAFYVSTLRREIARYRSLDYKKPGDIDKSVAKIEFFLTKALLRYVSGQRYGFVNPNRVLNDSVSVSALPVIRPDTAFCHRMLRLVSAGSIMPCVWSSRPTNPEFYELQAMQRLIPASDTLQRQRFAVAMERRRWQFSLPDSANRYVLVNIPACRLWAVSPDSTINMKVVCGSTKTPSPLLRSSIYRIDLNPRWEIPHSIVKKSLLHVGPGYLKSRHMYFVDKATGKKLDYAKPQQRLDGTVRMVQEGGEGNSLGRIIFRFKNDFAVYLHSTNAPWAFDADSRTESHGCIRVAEPYSLALMVMGDRGDDVAQKLWYSLNYDTDEPDKSMLLNYVKIDDPVPVSLDYQTVFKSPQTHRWISYDDIYGYDAKMYNSLKYWLHD